MATDRSPGQGRSVETRTNFVSFKPLEERSLRGKEKKKSQFGTYINIYYIHVCTLICEPHTVLSVYETRDREQCRGKPRRVHDTRLQMLPNLESRWRTIDEKVKFLYIIISAGEEKRKKERKEGTLHVPERRERECLRDLSRRHRFFSSPLCALLSQSSSVPVNGCSRVLVIRIILYNR